MALSPVLWVSAQVNSLSHLSLQHQSAQINPRWHTYSGKELIFWRRLVESTNLYIRAVDYLFVVHLSTYLKPSRQKLSGPPRFPIMQRRTEVRRFEARPKTALSSIGTRKIYPMNLQP